MTRLRSSSCRKVRRGDLSKEQWLDLFAVWRDHYRARLEAKTNELRERVATLWQQLEALISERAALPLPQQGAVTEKIAAIGRELAELNTPIEPPPAGEWG